MHGSVGGGGEDPDLSRIALVWMIEQVRGHHLGLAFDDKYLNTSKVITLTMKKPWGCADYQNSDKGIWKLAGSAERTPGKYGGAINESVHHTVDARLDFNKGSWIPWTAPSGITGMARDPLGTWEEELKKKYPRK